MPSIQDSAARASKLAAEATRLMGTSDFSGAADSWHAALQIQPSFAHWRSGLGDAFAALGRLDEAEAEYHQAIDLEPQHARAYLGMGDVALQHPLQARRYDAVRWPDSYTHLTLPTT